MSTQESQTTFTGRIDYDRFRQFIDPIAAVVDECRLRIDEDGWTVEAVDPANVAIVRVTMGAEVFEEYDAEETEFGVALRKIVRLLEYFEGSEVELEHNAQFKKLYLRAGDYSYTAATIDSDSVRQDPTLPDMDLNAEIEIGGARFKKAVEYFDEFSQHAAIGYDMAADEFYMEGMEKGGTDDGEVRIPAGDLTYVRQPESAHSLYSVHYLRDFADGIPDGASLTIEVGEEFPMVMTYEFARPHGEVKMMQAPRIAD